MADDADEVRKAIIGALGEGIEQQRVSASPVCGATAPPRTTRAS